MEVKKEFIDGRFVDRVCLDVDEVEIIIPGIKHLLSAATEREEKYRDIHESGEATERDTNLLAKWSNRTDKLSGLLDSCYLFVYGKEADDE